MTMPEVDGPIGYVTDLEGNLELWNRFIQCLGNIGNLVSEGMGMKDEDDYDDL